VEVCLDRRLDMKLTNGVYGLTHDAHGGGCCGITHLSEFPVAPQTESATVGEKVRWIRGAVEELVESEYDEACDSAHPEKWRCAVEAVLTDQQLPCWREALEVVGFRLVVSFVNDNSGNTCNVFYLKHGEV
jgi:hypothetical protein